MGIEFIKLSNEYLDGALSSEEIYLFCYLRDWCNYRRGITRISINGLNEYVKFLTVDKKNKIRIGQILHTLKQKGIINYVGVDIKPVDCIDITFPIYNTWEKNYTSIPNTYLDLTDDYELFALMVIIKRWEDTNYGLSYRDIAQTLNISERKAFDLVVRANEIGLISTSTGKFTIEHKQEKNKYVVKNTPGKKNIGVITSLNNKRKYITKKEYFFYKDNPDHPDINRANVEKKLEHLRSKEGSRAMLEKFDAKYMEWKAKQQRSLQMKKDEMVKDLVKLNGIVVNINDEIIAYENGMDLTNVNIIYYQCMVRVDGQDERELAIQTQDVSYKTAEEKDELISRIKKIVVK